MKTTVVAKKLTKKFYKRDLLKVARELPGKTLIRREGKYIYAGRIVEVEAYDGEIDRAAHSFGGKTRRNEVMFNEGGYLYVYQSYGMHFCCNVVTGVKNKGTAILIRALEPIEGVKRMIQNRFGRELLNEKEKLNLTSGPGKVCKSFGINKTHSGIDLTGDEIFIANSQLKKNEVIGISRRIGITKSVQFPWRFYIKNNQYLSRK